MSTPGLTELARIVLPEGISDYFDLTRQIQSPVRIDFYLEELNIPPEEYAQDRLLSKGFYEEIIIEDFPIRGCSVYLHVKRRRWENITSGKIVSRNWDLVSKGARYTKEFASFLKDISGHDPC